MHSIRPICGLSGARVGDGLVHPTHKFEHDVVLFERKLPLDFDALDQFLRINLAHKRQGASFTRSSYRCGPEEQGIILLRTIEVCSPGIARKGLNTLLQRQYVPDHLPDTIRICQTNAFSFRNQEMLEQLANPFEGEPYRAQM